MMSYPCPSLNFFLSFDRNCAFVMQVAAIEYSIAIGFAAVDKFVTCDPTELHLKITNIYVEGRVIPNNICAAIGRNKTTRSDIAPSGSVHCTTLYCSM